MIECKCVVNSKYMGVGRTSKSVEIKKKLCHGQQRIFKFSRTMNEDFFFRMVRNERKIDVALCEKFLDPAGIRKTLGVRDLFLHTHYITKNRILSPIIISYYLFKNSNSPFYSIIARNKHS